MKQIDFQRVQSKIEEFDEVVDCIHEDNNAFNNEADQQLVSWINK